MEVQTADCLVASLCASIFNLRCNNQLNVGEKASAASLDNFIGIYICTILHILLASELFDVCDVTVLRHLRMKAP